ncbi:MAG TPA: hypothetical protein VGO68_02680 [Pyrinomonadaceae bacterium]|jgi:hypothetical protein|nr:hypothetical protein [Pyrinomonadaceae bacterium]
MKATLLALFAISVFVTVSPVLQGQTSPNSTPTTPAVKAPADECGCDVPLPEVLATVNGIKITRLELTANDAQIKELQQQVITARKRELDLQINSQLLDEEAKKRGVSTRKVLEADVVTKVAEPTAAEAQAFYDQNKARLATTDFAAVKTEIIDYLRDQRQTEQAGLLANRLRAAAQIKLSGTAVSPPASEADLARVFATVNGKNITSATIEDALKPLVTGVQDQVYALRKSEIEMKINDILLELEGKKRSVTLQSLLQTEVAAKVPTFSEADAQKFYDENKERLNGDFATVKAQILEYLLEKANREQEQNFAQRLRNAATVQIFLTPPIAPRVNNPDPPKSTP